MRLLLAICVALLASACGGRLASEPYDQTPEPGNGAPNSPTTYADGGITCTATSEWGDDGGLMETCRKGEYTVTIYCDHALVCRSPTNVMTAYGQDDFCDDGGVLAAFAVCGYSP